MMNKEITEQLKEISDTIHFSLAKLKRAYSAIIATKRKHIEFQKEWETISDDTPRH
jgi:hypothetical protein